MDWKRLAVAYYFGRDTADTTNVIELTPDAQGALVVTGDQLIDQIYQSIVIRRPVLVTGPRGSGKSYCSEKAIRKAVGNNRIGGWHFLQGNREIPRDYLSEDMLVIGADKKPELRRALILQGGGVDPTKDWPGVLASEVKQGFAEAKTKWKNTDWYVLYLDEINRFGDGFLDSLLSLTEENKIVRRGKEYYVPIVVVATANPPGYDVTAKKLSPPLQARIARSYRVSQPPLDVLVDKVLDSALTNLQTTYSTKIDADGRGMAIPVGVKVAREQLYRVAATTLCLWGDPKVMLSGHYYLAQETRAQLRLAAMTSPKLASAMRTLNQYILFGPDARAAADWLGAAIAKSYYENVEAPIAPDKAIKENEALPIRNGDFRATAIEVLSHKIRESFNEGTEPDKTIVKERCVSEIVGALLSEDLTEVHKIFLGVASIPADPPADDAKKTTLRHALSCLPDAPRDGLSLERRHLWKCVLPLLPDTFKSADQDTAKKDIKQWRDTRVIPMKALQHDGEFIGDDKDQLVKLLTEYGGQRLGNCVRWLDEMRGK